MEDFWKYLGFGLMVFFCLAGLGTCNMLSFSKIDLSKKHEKIIDDIPNPK